MKEPYESLLENQQKVLELWNKAGQDVLKEFGQLNQTWQKATNMEGMKKTVETTPDQMEAWMKMQNEMGLQWLRFYQEQMQKWSGNLPGMNGAPSENLFQQSQKNWENWLAQANQWIKENLEGKIPFAQQAHYQNFNDLYHSFAKQWEPIQKMIQFGIFKWEGMEAFFSPKAYQELVGKYMGFKPQEDPASLLKQANQVFDYWTNWLKDRSKDPDAWAKMFESDFLNQPNSALKAAIDVNHTVQKGLESFYLLAGPNKEVEMARLLKDIQFGYVAFLMHTMELQSKVYEGSRDALPETIRHFTKEYEEKKVLPEFKSFFSRYTDVLENHMLEVLNSDAYSTLQAKVAQIGIEVKSKMNKLVELAFADMPFLTHSYADDVATETTALRKKIRTLETRLAELEKLVQKPATNGKKPAVVKKETGK